MPEQYSSCCRKFERRLGASGTSSSCEGGWDAPGPTPERGPSSEAPEAESVGEGHHLWESIRDSPALGAETQQDI